MLKMQQDALGPGRWRRTVKDLDSEGERLDRGLFEKAGSTLHNID